jgi:hypothetical protein
MPWDKDPSTVTMTLADEAPSRGHVAPKWRGTQADQADMSALGRDQVLRVRSPVLLWLMHMR